MQLDPARIKSSSLSSGRNLYLATYLRARKQFVPHIKCTFLFVPYIIVDSMRPRKRIARISRFSLQQFLFHRMFTQPYSISWTTTWTIATGIFFLSALYHIVIPFCARSSSRFCAVRLGHVSIFTFSSPEFRSKKVLRFSIPDRLIPLSLV